MATMVPEDVEQFNTEGERLFYRFMETAALPNDQFFCWYTPDIKGNEPDFILYSKMTGLVVFEVKDWTLEQIIAANPHSFTLIVNNRRTVRKNPYRQAQAYVHEIFDLIRADGQLVAKDPKHLGRPKIPIDCGVVFPNINKFEYTGKGFDSIIDPAKAFFWGDLLPESDYCQDRTGTRLAQALVKKFPPKFTCRISDKEFQRLKYLIFPSIRLELPARSAGLLYEERVSRLKALDHHQEVLARKFDGGHRIIMGPSGSGKTLVLVHKARFLLTYNPRIRRILFVCFNITLVNYLKRLLANLKVPLGENGVEVFHFYDLCAQVIKTPVAYEKQETAYFDLVEQETLSRLAAYDKRYDAVLVDEGQDYSDRMLRIIVSFLNPKTNNLTIAFDDRQELYQRRSSWRNVGIEVRGRVHQISRVYRSTKELTDFAAKFEARTATPDKNKELQLALFPEDSDFHGPPPVIRQFADYDAIMNDVATRIEKIVAEDGCPYSEIAVIYTKKKFKDRSTQFIPEKMQTVLNSHGIMCNWASKDYVSKSSYDITTNSVTISTIHSSKGFDYACVFVLGLDLLKENGWTRAQIDNLVYVAVTRARYRLFVPYIDETLLIRNLKELSDSKCDPDG